MAISKKSDSANNLPFGKKNYLWMVIGIITIFFGFTIMSLDQEEFGFGFLGLTLGPIVVLAGFIIEYYAILTKDPSKK